MKFRYFEHTADAKFEAYGKTMEEAFANSALAMFNIIADIAKVKKSGKVHLIVNADSYEKLLFDFLSELLFYMDTEFLIFSDFNITITEKQGNFELECTAYGDKASVYDTKGDVKAMTYNEMSISEGRQGVVIQAVVDL